MTLLECAKVLISPIPDRPEGCSSATLSTACATHSFSQSSPALSPSACTLTTPPSSRLSCLPFHSPFLFIFHLLFLILCPPQQNKPLYSFEDNADYVYDVMWSPVHPSLFAAVDGMGRLDLWNLNNDTEVR